MRCKNFDLNPWFRNNRLPQDFGDYTDGDCFTPIDGITMHDYDKTCLTVPGAQEGFYTRPCRSDAKLLLCPSFGIPHPHLESMVAEPVKAEALFPSSTITGGVCFFLPCIHGRVSWSFSHLWQRGLFTPFNQYSATSSSFPFDALK